jgi:hypothetical protein
LPVPTGAWCKFSETREEGPLSEPQSFKNHQQRARGFLAASGLLTINLAWAFYRVGRDLSGDTLVGLLVAVALIVLAFSLRTQVLTVQDRVIRTEMRLRLARILPEDLAGQIERLAPRQLVALRFASDSELPALVREVLDGSLTKSDDIKRRVKDWQADHLVPEGYFPRLHELRRQEPPKGTRTDGGTLEDRPAYRALLGLDRMTAPGGGL